MVADSLVPVIAYNRPIQGADYYVSFKAQGTAVLLTLVRWKTPTMGADPDTKANVTSLEAS